MPWAQKDDGAWTDSTLANLTDRTYRLYDNCWTFAANKLTDGRISRDEVARVAFMFGLTDPDCLTKAINEIVHAGLWTQDLIGYSMVGWLQQNRLKQDVLSTRQLARERQARWREKAAQKAATAAAKRQSK
jgi:hypothetical protein